MQKDIEKKRGTLDKWMDFIERVGNALPDPVSLFIIRASWHRQNYYCS